MEPEGEGGTGRREEKRDEGMDGERGTKEWGGREGRREGEGRKAHVPL